MNTSGASAGSTAPPRAARVPGEQLALVRDAVRRARPKPVDPPALERPIARVAVDLPLAHLDRPFDYLVTESQSAAAIPGVRVRVHFAGQELDGFVLDRVDGTAHQGRLTPLRRVVSAEPVLAVEVLTLARAVADRYAGTLADVLRLAVPARHARTEDRPTTPMPERPLAPVAPPPGPWARYPGGPAYLAALSSGGAPRAVWTALPGPDWPRAIAVAVQAALAGGRGALVVAPDGRDVARIDAALGAQLGPGHHVALTAELGPAERYRRWLAVRRGAVGAVVGTRAAAFAPVADLGLVVVWDDGDDLHAEPRAPYPHVREVLCLRSQTQDAAALVGGHARTAEGALLLRTGWARPLVADRTAVRALAPRVQAAAGDVELARDGPAAAARLPTIAWRTAKEGLARGPVLVQVPRSGYLPVLACVTCRSPARCVACHGPLALSAGGAPAHCGWCARPATAWRCPSCESPAFRAQVVGATRTAEELGRAFPAVPVRTSGRDGVLADVGSEPALVVATPGAEPVAAGGYAAALLLDGWALLGRPDLRAGEEALRRWLGAAALVRPAREGGVVVVCADAGLAPVQALVRWDPAGAAERELDDRAAVGFPPAARLVALEGTAVAVADLVHAAAAAGLPAGAQVLGPVPVGASSTGAAPGSGDSVRTLLRVSRADAPQLAAALRAAQATRSARKAGDPVRGQIDPTTL